jgi:hypothetical protein
VGIAALMGRFAALAGDLSLLVIVHRSETALVSVVSHWSVLSSNVDRNLQRENVFDLQGGSPRCSFGCIDVSTDLASNGLRYNPDVQCIHPDVDFGSGAVIGVILFYLSMRPLKLLLTLKYYRFQVFLMKLLQ